MGNTAILAIRIISDSNKANAGIRKVGEQLRKVSGDADNASKHWERIGSGFAEVGQRMSKILNVAAAVGPALSAVAAAASAAASGATALVGALAPVAAGGAAVYAGGLLAVKQATFAVQFATSGLSAALAGTKGAMAKLTPPAQAFVRQLKSMKPEIETVRTVLQTSAFPGFTDALKRIAGTYLPQVALAAKQTGVALGGLAVRASKMVTSGPWKKDFATVTRNNAHNLSLMGRAGLYLADAARSLFVTAQPLIRAFFQWAVGAAKSVDSMVQAGRASGALAAFWKTAATNGATLGRILGNLGVALANVFRIGAAQSGAGLLTTVEKITAQFREWTSSKSGVSKIAGWFRQGQTNLAAMGKLAAAFAKTFSGVGAGGMLAPLLNQIRKEVVPALGDLVRNANISGALNELVKAVGTIVRVFAKLEKSDSSVKAFAGTLNILANAALFLIKHVPGASKVMSVFFTAMGAGLALKVVGLGGLVESVGRSLVGLAGKFLLDTTATETNTAAVASNTLAQRLSQSTAATWLGVKALEVGAWVRGAAAAVANTTATVASAAAQKAAAVASKAYAAAQWLVNVAMEANPIGLVIAAIVALVAIIVIAWKHSETFRKIVIGAWNAIKSATKAVWDWIKNAVSAVWRFLVAYVKTEVRILHAVISVVWNAIKKVTSTVWNGIKSVLHAVWTFIVSTIKGNISRAKAIVVAVWTFLKDATGRAWDALKRVVQAAIVKVVGFVVGMKNRITNFFRNAGTWLINAGKNIISGLINGIKAMFGKVRDALGSLTSKLTSWKGPASKDRKLLTKSGQLIMDGLIAGFRSRHNAIRASLGDVTRLVQGGINPTLGTRGGTIAAGAGGAVVYQITVNGALDPVAVGNQLDTILSRRGRRIGKRPA